MGLEIVERIEDIVERVRFRATDAETGNPVGVRISHEAFNDYGEAACLERARQKYRSPENSVDVTTEDFRGAART